MRTQREESALCTDVESLRCHGGRIDVDVVAIENVDVWQAFEPPGSE
jgi:hypothetical protein